MTRDLRTKSLSINQVLAKRKDLSPCIVHLTRDTNGRSARDVLISIIDEWKLRAINPMGRAARRTELSRLLKENQKVVCFTEVPWEYLSLLVVPIKGRQINFGPYGIAVTRAWARENGVNPIWYLDQTRGHNWLTTPFDKILRKALKKPEEFDEHPVAELAPFIDVMGTGTNTSSNQPYAREFWWEREWRHVKDLILPHELVVLCPESERRKFKKIVADHHYGRCPIIDPTWSGEKIERSLRRQAKREFRVVSLPR